MENLKNCGRGEPRENKLFQLKPYDNFFFFEDIKMEYINTGNANFSIQGVSKRASQTTKCHTKYIHELHVSQYPNRLKGPTTISANHKQTWHY
jgi:hypothetical protein